MSLTSSLQRIVQAKADIKTAIENKGVTVGDDVSIANYDDYIDAITTGGGGSTQTKTVSLSMASGDQVITPDTGYTLTQVTVEKPSTLIASNIKDGVSIGGVTGSYTASPTLTTKTITANGTYNASSDSADGYSSVTVNVSGGGGGGLSADSILDGSVTTVESYVTKVKYYALANCTSLTSVSFPNATICDIGVCRGATALTSASFPNITTIGQYAFAGCTSLTNLTFTNATEVGSYAFNGCSAFQSISLSNITTIGNNAFENCTSLRSVTLPALKTIGDYAFSGCNNSNFTSFSMPEVTTIGQYAFQSVKLTSVSAPKVTSIGQRAFTSQTSITTVDIPECLTLANHVFYGASSMTSLTAPKLTSIGNYALYNVRITSLTLRNTSVVTLGGTSNFRSGTNVTIYVPSNLVDSYKTATNWSTLFNNGRVNFKAISE